MITLKEIAAQSGVSIATVSNILNGKSNVSEATKQRVMQIVKETGYRPNYMARSLRSSKTNTIGVIIEDITNFSSPLQIDGITAALEYRGYKLILENLRYYTKYNGVPNHSYVESVQSAIQEMLTIKVDGIVYVAGHTRNIDFLPSNLPIPFVVSYSGCNNPAYPYVVIDDVTSAFNMTEFLISKGHTKIGIIAGSKNNEHSDQRLIGWEKSMKNHGLSLDPSFIFFGDWKRESGYNCCKKLFETSKDITAIFCFNDLMAAGVYDYLKENNMTAGKDISVVGFDNREVSTFLVPQLTTMEIPLPQFGVCAAEALLKLIDEEKLEGQEVRVMCKLIERASVK
ncbi:MAG: LacI family DNA-binding transcriptional regulator [Treponema sp.]|nr:LacI family DNA-binding transcriptional regulator [Treponema sp.]